MAQPDSSGMSSTAEVAVDANQPVPTGPCTNPMNSTGFIALGAPAMVAGAGPIPARTAGNLSIPEVVLASLFDDIYSEQAQGRWTPLYLRDYLTDGWNTPFVSPTSSSAGAPRQGWVGAFDGQFFRAWFFAFAYDQGLNSHLGNGYVGRYTIFAPSNRRLEFQWDSLFIVSNKGGSSNTYHGNVGDQTFWLKTLLCETKNYGYGCVLGINVPTGRTENGQGLNYLQPGFRYLWFPFGGN
jgi:hypothetical protein